jgi:hypothetical protein
MSCASIFTAALVIAGMISAQAAQTGYATMGDTIRATVPGGVASDGNTVAVLNQDFYNYIFFILVSLTVALGIWRVGIESVKYVRTLTCLNNQTQRYFALPSKTFAGLKRNLLYAPIFSKRHNREFQLSAAVNVGTLPTRLQLLFLVGYFGTNVAFCAASIQWSATYTTVCQQLRNRTGILAVVNMASSCPLISPLSRGAWILITLRRFTYSSWRHETIL